MRWSPFWEGDAVPQYIVHIENTTTFQTLVKTSSRCLGLPFRSDLPLVVCIRIMAYRITACRSWAKGEPGLSLAIGRDRPMIRTQEEAWEELLLQISNEFNRRRTGVGLKRYTDGELVDVALEVKIQL